MKRILLAVTLMLAVVAPAFAQMDHADIARAAFEASALPPPPRSVESALPFITRLLSMLPAGERAGYVRGPAGGENVWPLSDGTLVRISRVMYPNGQIYKVLSDAPNGNPQWAPEDVRPELYVPFAGPPVVVVPPPVVLPPPVIDLQASALAAILEEVKATRADVAAFREDVNHKLRAAMEFIGKYIAPILAGLAAGWRFGPG